jgi:hypothetical protein
MRDEIFDIEISYNDERYQFTVKTDYPAGPECMGCDYDIFKGRKHLYTISQCKNEDGIECWEVKKKPAKGYHPELPQLIGKAIDHHYN